MMRRLVPYSLLPLSLIACALASAPWLRAFPSAVIGIPLFGAAALSVLVPMIVVGIGVRRLWITALIDAVVLIFFELFVTLRAPTAFDSLYTGLVHGPSQILTFALPLVSPRSLLVAPVALCWISGAVIGECVARGWRTTLPHLSLLVTFGLAYAGTARAITSTADGRRYDTLFAATLLLALLLMRAAQVWLAQDEGADTTQPDGMLPLRGLAVAAVLAVLVAAGAAGLGQSPALSGRPATPDRVPPLHQSQALTPVSFIAGLRPSDPRRAGTSLFRVTTDRASSNYISLATVDYYDGDGWTFTRTFRPSGGVVPADADPAMHAPGRPVTQQYVIGKGQLSTVPWMPYLDRAQRVTGAAVNIDVTSGMVVPARALRPGETYTVRSDVASKTFDQLGHTAALGTSAAPVDTTLANGLAAPLGTLVHSLEMETGVSSDQVIPFLQAVARDFRTRSGLAGAPAVPSSHPSAASAASAASGGARTSRRPTTTPTPAPSASPHTGGTSFADVLASIRGSHSATPEQYATLTALIARQLTVPARVVSGFRITPSPGATRLAAGTYDVTTAEAWTWVEIPIRGLGWVVLDPSPGIYAAAPPQRNAAGPPSPTPTPTPSQNALLTHASDGGHAVAPSSSTPHGQQPSAPAVALVVAIVGAAALALLIAIRLARKQLRARRRRRSGDPRRRLLGAWQEGLDVLAESGLPDLSALTSAEVAESTLERFGREPAAQARYLGDAANLAIFSPTTWIGPEQADAAWRAEDWLRRTVRRRLHWRERITAGLRYHRPNRPRVRTAAAPWAAAARQRAIPARGKHVRPVRQRTRRPGG